MKSKLILLGNEGKKEELERASRGCITWRGGKEGRGRWVRGMWETGRLRKGKVLPRGRNKRDEEWIVE